MKFKKLTEEILEEGYWYELTTPSNTHYYAFLRSNTDQDAYEEEKELIYDTKSWKRRTHETINQGVLDSLLSELGGQNGNLPSLTRFEKNAFPPSNSLVLTPTVRELRSLSYSFVDDSIKELIEKDGLGPSCLVHHLNEKEYDMDSSNLVAIPYKDNSDLKVAQLVHKILHQIGPSYTVDGGQVFKRNYYLLVNGKPVKKEMTIYIK